MSDAKGQHEQSMEDILASIRRIIAEDTGTAPAIAAPQPAPADEILDLTEIIRDAPAAPAPPPVAAAPAMRDNEPAGDLAGAIAREALARLAQTDEPERAPARGVRLGDPARTLEDVVRDLLRPLVQSWVDRHLRSLVADMVREEIARVAREKAAR